ncbi:MAG: glycine cleavage system protein R [Actinomycetota bacterium]
MSDRNLVAVTVVGNDRPGIVAGVTRLLYESGCNLEDASSTILRGHFSMMLIVSAPGELSAPELEAKLATVAEELALSITARSVDEAVLQVDTATHMVSVYGADQPGIVYRVAAELASSGINITALSSRVIGSESQPVYALMLEVVADDELEARLDRLRAELGMDVSVHPIGPDVL